MKLVTRSFTTIAAALCLVVALSGFACTSSAVTAIDAVVIAAEGVIPFIPNVSPENATLINQYLNSALTITGDLTSCGATQACVSAAAADFQSLVLPTLSGSISPQIAGLLNAVANAIGKFVTTYKPPPASGGLALKAKKAVPLSASDKARIAKINIRIVAAKAKLAKR